MNKQWIRQAAAAAAVIALLASAVGCSNEQEPKADSQAEAPQEAQDGKSSNTAVESPQDEAASKQLLQEYDLVINEAEQAKEIVAFIDERMSEAPAEAVDVMARRLLDYYEEDLAAVEKAFEQADVQAELLTADWPITLESAATIPNDRIRKLVEDTLQGGYKLMNAEGYVYPQVDYGAWTSHASRLSPEVSDYMALRALETDRPTVVDGGLIISWDELGSRVLQAEQYLRDYPKTEVYEEIQTLLERYMAVYLQGVDNTPIYSYEGYRVLDEVDASYRKLAAENPGTAAAGAVNGYLQLLEARDWRILEGDSASSGVAPEIMSYWEGLRLMLDELLHG